MSLLPSTSMKRSALPICVTEHDRDPARLDEETDVNPARVVAFFQIRDVAGIRRGPRALASPLTLVAMACRVARLSTSWTARISGRAQHIADQQRELAQAPVECRGRQHDIPDARIIRRVEEALEVRAGDRELVGSSRAHRDGSEAARHRRRWRGIQARSSRSGTRSRAHRQRCSPSPRSERQSAPRPVWRPLSMRSRSGLLSNRGTPAGEPAGNGSGSAMPGSLNGRAIPCITPKKMPSDVEVADGFRDDSAGRCHDSQFVDAHAHALESLEGVQSRCRRLTIATVSRTGGGQRIACRNQRDRRRRQFCDGRDCWGRRLGRTRSRVPSLARGCRRRRSPEAVHR